MSAIRGDTYGSQAVGLAGPGSEFVDTKKAVVAETDLARVLGGNDVIAARKALKDLTPAARKRAFQTPIRLETPSGDVMLLPVFHAARRGAVHMLALYAGMHAALNETTSRGLSPLQEALFGLNLEAAKTMLATPSLREALVDTRRVSLDEVHALIATLPVNASEDALNAATLKLAEGNLKLLEITDRLAIYHAHVYDNNDSSLVLTAKGWHPESALEQRTRTLIGMAAQKSEPGSKLRHALVKEIATTIEALHLERRVYTATNIPDSQLARRAIEHEVDGIMRRLETAVAHNNPECRGFLIPIGTEAHQMYMELEPCYVDGVPHVLLRFDNRGAGCEAHTTAEDGSLYPIRSIIPVADGDPHAPRMNSELRTLLTDLLVQRAKGTVAKVYQALYAWMTAMMDERGINAIENPSEREAAWPPQAGGTCTIANIQPGTARRLGEYSDAFFDFELADVVRRIAASVQPDKLTMAPPPRGKRFAPVKG